MEISMNPLKKHELHCHVCGGPNVTEVLQNETFDYMVGGQLVSLQAQYLVQTCSDCNFVTAGEDAEIARDNAVRKYLNLLMPQEIRAIREKYSLSRKEFAELTGIGIASITRWENGEVLQNRSIDTLLKFIAEPSNFNKLKSGFKFDSNVENPTKNFPKMRALTGHAFDIAVMKSSEFRLNLRAI